MAVSEARRATVKFGPVDIEREELGGGSFVLRSRVPLKDYPHNLTAWLHHWADKAGERTFLAQREAGEWRELSFAEMLEAARAIGAALLARGLGAERPVMILSDNSLANAMLSFGAIYAGIPVVPVSPAYSLMSADHAKLKHIYALVKPGMIYAEDGAQFAKALAALDLTGVEVVTLKNAPDGMSVTPFDALTAGTPDAALERANEAITADTVAKVLFTSGSTGMPKGVINTHGMLTSNQQAALQCWAFLGDNPPVTVDWLPWHHTFGGNHNLYSALANGGSLYIDHGKPAPGLIEQTVENLRDIAPTVYFNVPRGYDMLLPYLEADEALRDKFFSRMDMLFYAAAALPQNLWQRLEALSVAARGEKVVMISSWGATETSPMITSVHFPIDRAGVIGVPAPGCELKFVPNAGKLEMRVKGPNVFPGYFRQDDLTKKAFDEDGWYKIGDAGKLADESDPASGVVFDGRVAEDFKLTTGTWVNAGNLRIAAISAGAPVIQDAAVTGHDRDEIGLLVFPNVPACAQIAGKPADTPVAELIADEAVRARLAEGIAAYNRDNPQSSTRIARVLLMTAPPSIDANEITDKGYLNQRAVLTSRADLVEKLYGDSDDVIRP